MNEISKSFSFEIDGRKFETITVSLENALSVYIYEEIPRLGVFGISVPSTSIMPASTLFVTGTKDEHFVRIIGERLATKVQRLVLISFSLKDASNELLLKIVNKIENELIIEEEKE